MLSLRFVVVMLACLAGAIGLPRCARADTGDDTLHYYLSRSDVVVLGQFTSELDASHPKTEVIIYGGDFKIAQILKGKALGQRRIGGTIKVCVLRFESKAADRLPELKKGGKCILFLKYQERQSPAYLAADSFGVQRANPWMAESLARLAAREQAGKKAKILTPKELDAHWQVLAGNDAAKAYKAVWTLVAGPERSVPLLNKHLKPVPLPDPNQVDKLLTALDSDSFPEREKAMAQLEKMGAPVLDRITKALQEKPSLEKRRRLEMLRDKLSPFTLSGKELRTWRALEVLERIGNEPARQVLRRLAKGAPGVWQTREARMALERLANPWRQRASFAGNSNEQMKVLSLAFSPDSRLVASGSEGWRGKDFEAPAQVILWDTRAGKRVRTLAGHDCFSVTSILFFPDGKTLASGSRDGTVKLWDLHTGKLQRTFEVSAAQSRPKEFQSSEVTCLALAADGRTIAAGTGWEWVVLWDVQTGQVKHRLKHANGINSLAFSSDGKILATLAHHVRLWDVTSGQEKKKMLNESAGAWTIAFSPDAKLLASGSDGKVCLWDARTAQLQRKLEAAGENILHLAFSADGQSLVGSGNQGTVFVWDVQSGKVEHKLPTGSAGAKPLALSTNGRLLATGGKDNTVILWEATKTASGR